MQYGESNSQACISKGHECLNVPRSRFLIQLINDWIDKNSESKSYFTWS